MYTKRGNRNLKVAPSVYGGAGGHGTRISNFRHWANYGSGYLHFGNEKMAMQNLNDRLAIYLEKVRTLEQFNSKLELKIKQWYEKNTPSTGRDYSAYYRQINELKNQIKEAQQEKARCVLKIDNIKMAADDFRLTYENERGMCLAVEADIQGLSKVFDDLTLCKTDLELQIEHLNEELIILKKEHQEEVDSLRKQLGNTVNVQLKAVPGQSLSAIIDKMRQKYEALAQKNLQKAKEQFKIQTEALQQQVTVNATDLKESETQLKDLSHTYKNLSINLNSHLSMKDSLEQTLQDTKARYHRQLAAIQKLLNTLEAQMIQIRTDAERQSKEFDALLDIKTRLEQEIATYRRLLEGKDMSTTGYQIKHVGGQRDKENHED